MPDQPSDSPERANDSPALPAEPLRAEPPSSDLLAASGSEPTPPPAAGEPVELLNQILTRLQRMEGGLSQHEQWLRRIEQEQSQAEPPPSAAQDPSESELQRLIGSLTLERDRSRSALAEAEQRLGEYQRELVNLRHKADQLQEDLAKRERELGQIRQNATKGAEQARSLQSQAQRELQSRQEQAESIKAELAGARRQLTQRDAQVAELQSAVNRAAERFEQMAAEWAARSTEDTASSLADRAWSRFARVAVVAALASGLASVALTAWLHQQARAGAPRTYATTVLLPGADTQGFHTCVTQLDNEPDIEVIADADRRTIELRHRSQDRSAALARLDGLAAGLIERMAPSTELTATQPASLPVAAGLTARIHETQTRLRQTTRPAEAVIEDLPRPAVLADRWRELSDEHARVQQQIRELTGKLEASQSQPAAPEIAPEQIARVEAADPQLQSETEALAQREEQLAGRLRVTLDTAALQFQSLQQALTQAEAQLVKDLADEHPEEIANQLVIVKDSLGRWTRALADLDSAWKQQRDAIAARGALDVLNVQSQMEKAARSFVTEITAASTELTRAIENIGQGQDQTTKRLVLRNALTKQLAPVTTAQQMVGNAARAVILTENVELTGIVQRLDALRRQIQQRRAQLAGSLRQERMGELQRVRSLQVARLRQEQQALAARAAEIETTLLGLGDQAARLAAAHAGQSQWLTNQTLDLQQMAEDLKALLGLHEGFAERVASWPPPAAPIRTPALPLDDAGAGLSFAAGLLLGITPVLVCAAGLALAWLIISSRRSRQTIEEYARTLKETARRVNLHDESPVS